MAKKSLACGLKFDSDHRLMQCEAHIDNYTGICMSVYIEWVIEAGKVERASFNYCPTALIFNR